MSSTDNVEDRTDCRMSYSGFNRCTGMACQINAECGNNLCMGGFCAKDEGTGIFLPILASSALGLAILLTLYIVWRCIKKAKLAKKNAESDMIVR